MQVLFYVWVFYFILETEKYVLSYLGFYTLPILPNII